MLYKTFKGQRETDDAATGKGFDEAQAPSNMGLFPGWRLHPLTGNMTGFWSVTVSGNWRLIFRFEDGQAFDVDLVDYH